MSIVPNEVNITKVTLSSTLDDIFSAHPCGERSLGAFIHFDEARSDDDRTFAAYHRYRKRRAAAAAASLAIERSACAEAGSS